MFKKCWHHVISIMMSTSLIFFFLSWCQNQTLPCQHQTLGLYWQHQQPHHLSWQFHLHNTQMLSLAAGGSELGKLSGTSRPLHCRTLGSHHCSAGNSWQHLVGDNFFTQRAKHYKVTFVCNVWRSGKQWAPWSNTTFCSIWSASTLLAEDCLFWYNGENILKSAFNLGNHTFSVCIFFSL